MQSTDTTWHDTSWHEAIALIDTIGLFAIGLLIVLGLARGLWWQVVRLIGVAAAVAVARTWHEELSRVLLDRWSELEPRLAVGISWLALFIAGMSVATLFGRLGAGLLSAMQLGLANRVAGGVLGAATGLLLHVTLLVAICQLAPSMFLQRHVAGSWSERLLHALAVDRSVVLGAETGAQLRGLDLVPNQQSTDETGTAPEPDDATDDANLDVDTREEVR